MGPPFDDFRPDLTLEEFRLLRELVYEHCGIRLRDDMKTAMARRLWPRLEALSLGDFAAYYRYLLHHQARRVELEAAVEALATHETYFFREPVQLRAFQDEVLPLLHKRNADTRRLRIWSAGCSTGEEVYTLAMLVRETGLFEGWKVEVYGTDISRRVLGTARKGEYGPSSLRVAAADRVERFFEPAEGNKKRVREEIRAMVDFGHLNLLDPEASGIVRMLMDRQDAIFCRNVMIYFDLPARRRLLKVLYENLVEGGYLLLGHSESLINLSTDFELVHLKDDLIYRRPVSRGLEQKLP